MSHEEKPGEPLEVRLQQFTGARGEALELAAEWGKEGTEVAARMTEAALRLEHEYPAPKVAEALRLQLLERVLFLRTPAEPWPPEAYAPPHPLLAETVRRVGVEPRDTRGFRELYLALEWPSIRAQWRQDYAAHLAARSCLHDLEGEEHAEGELAANRLEHAIQEELDNARETLGLPWDGKWEETEQDGMTEPDARLVKYARARWPEWEAVEVFQKWARARLSQYREQLHADLGVENLPPSPWRRDTRDAAGDLAVILWREKVKPELQRERASAPALAQTVADGVLGALWNRRTTRAGEHLVLDGEPVATISLAQASAVLDFFKVVRGLTAHRLFRFVVQEVFRQVFVQKKKVPWISIEGGMGELARLIGDHEGRPDLTRAALHALQVCHIHWENGTNTGGLLTWNETPGKGRTKGKVSITPNEALWPMFNLRELGQDAQILVPVVPLPPLLGRGNDHGAQVAFQLFVVREMVDLRAEMGEFKGVTLTDARLEAMAREAGLPEGKWGEVLAHWLTGDKHTPAFLERTEGGRYRLADNDLFRSARRFMEDTGKISVSNSKRATAGRNRRKALVKRKPSKTQGNGKDGRQ